MEPYTLVINNFDDGSETTCELAVGEEDNPADFHIAPLRGCDVNFCHSFGR